MLASNYVRTWPEPAESRGGRACPLCLLNSGVNLFRYSERIVDLDAEVADRALDARIETDAFDPLGDEARVLAHCHGRSTARRLVNRNSAGFLPAAARIAVHPTCSITHLQLTGTPKQIAAHLAEEVEVPIGTTCCGTAGDRGLLHPELVVSATREVKAVLDAHPAESYVSANRTCEMGLRQATGRPYESFVFLLEELSRLADG